MVVVSLLSRRRKKLEGLPVHLHPRPCIHKDKGVDLGGNILTTMVEAGTLEAGEIDEVVGGVAEEEETVVVAVDLDWIDPEATGKDTLAPAVSISHPS